MHRSLVTQTELNVEAVSLWNDIYSDFQIPIAEE